jgi:hypothetical protein
MSVYGLEVRYNGNCPVRCFSRERGGVRAHLYMVQSGQLRLDVSLKTAGRRTEYSLHPLVPGDSLSFTFLRRTRSGEQSIKRLHQLARKPLAWRKTPKFRIGLDIRLKTGETVRTSHPKRGGFSFMLSSVPFDHARAFVMAGNRTEYWHWQLPDLHADEEVSFHIVETDWFNEPPIVKPVPRNS